MKVKRVSSLFCAVAFFGTASMAMAGAYGEAEQAEEMPRSAPAVAETAEIEEFEPFAYLAVGGLYGKEFFEQEAHMINKTYGWGVLARGGFRFHPNVGAELLFEDVIEFDGDSGTNKRGREGNIDRHTWSLMPVVKIFPMEGWVEPFISLGAGLMMADHGKNNQVVKGIGRPTTCNGNAFGRCDIEDGYGFAMRFGLGADFFATENIFIEPEIAYVLPLTDNVEAYNHMTASLSIGYAFR